MIVYEIRNAEKQCNRGETCAIIEVNMFGVLRPTCLKSLRRSDQQNVAIMRSFCDGSQKFAVIIFNIFWNKTIAKSPITEDFWPLIKIRALKCHSLISINLCKEISLFIFFGACKLQNLPIAYFLCDHLYHKKDSHSALILTNLKKKISGWAPQ